MTCIDCKEAAVRNWPGMTEKCDMCRARQVSRMPSFRDSMLTGRLTRTYQDLLVVFRVTHEQVKEARAADAGVQK